MHKYIILHVTVYYNLPAAIISQHMFQTHCCQGRFYQLFSP